MVQPPAPSSTPSVRRTGRTRRAPGQWWRGDLSLAHPPHIPHPRNHLSAAVAALATEEADPETFRRHDAVTAATEERTSDVSKDDELNTLQSLISIVDGHSGGKRRQGQPCITQQKAVSKSSPTLFPQALPSPPHPLSPPPPPPPLHPTTTTTPPPPKKSSQEQHVAHSRSQHPSNCTSSSSSDDLSLSPIPSYSTPPQNKGRASASDSSTSSQQPRRRQQQQQQVLRSPSIVRTQVRYETESIVPNTKNTLNPNDEMTELQQHEMGKERCTKRARLSSDHSISGDGGGDDGDGDGDGDGDHHHQEMDTNDVASDHLYAQVGNNDEILEEVGEDKNIRAEHDAPALEHNAEARVMVQASTVDVANEDGTEEEKKDKNDNDEVHKEVRTQTADYVNRNKHVQEHKHEACILDEISPRSPSFQVTLPQIHNNSSLTCRPGPSSLPTKRARRSPSTKAVNTSRNSNEDQICNVTFENPQQESDQSDGAKQEMSSTSSPHHRRLAQQQQQQQLRKESPTFLSSSTLAETETRTAGTVGINEKHYRHQEQQPQQQRKQNTRSSHDKIIPSPPKQHAGRRRVQFLQAVQTTLSPQAAVSHRVSVGLKYDAAAAGDTSRPVASVVSAPRPIPSTPARLLPLTEGPRTNEHRTRKRRPIYKGARVPESQPVNSGFHPAADTRNAARANDENPTDITLEQIHVDNTDLDPVPLRDMEMDCDTEQKAGTTKDTVDRDVNTRTTYRHAQIYSSVGRRRQQQQQDAATLTTQTLAPAAETAEATSSQRRYYHLPDPMMLSPPIPSPSQSPVHSPEPDNSPPQALHRRAQQERRRHLHHGNLHRRRDLPSVMVVRDTELQFFGRTPSQRSSPVYTDASAVATSDSSTTTSRTLNRREQGTQRRRRRHHHRHYHHHHHHHHQYQHAANEHRHAHDVVDDTPLPIIPPPVRCALATTMDCAYVGEMMLGARCSSGVRHVMVCEETYHISHCFLGVVICETRVQTFRLSKGDYIMVERGDAIQFRNPSYVTCRILFIQARQASS